MVVVVVVVLLLLLIMMMVVVVVNVQPLPSVHCVLDTVLSALHIILLMAIP